MAVQNFNELLQHLGHKIVVVGYASWSKDTLKKHQDREYENVAIECEDCQEVLIDYDKASV